MRCHLIAVQAEMRLDHYRTAASFRRKILELTERAVAGLDGAPRLLAFPEAIGFPLLLALDRGQPLAAEGTVLGAAWGLVREDWRALLAAFARRPHLGPAALYQRRALAAYRVYLDTFAAAARSADATVVAGTIFLPRVETEAARGDHVADPRVFNTAYTFSPLGGLLGRSHKVHLTPGAEARAGLTRGAAEALLPLATPLGRVGVAICLDAFYHGVIGGLDGHGAMVVVQPSANHAPWERRWPRDPRYSEGEAWLELGLRRTIQSRLNIRYGVNPMLVGDLLDLHPRGRSSLVANLRYHPEVALEGYPGLLALAASSDREEVVRATVELP